MKNIYLFLVLTLCNLMALEIDGFSHPESVLAEGEVYVSNIGEKREALAKDKDGYISKLSEGGEVLERYFIKGLNAPKGMGRVGSVLYVADIDVVRGYDLTSKNQVFEISIDDAISLNDITILDGKYIFVSDNRKGVVYKIDIEKKKYEVFLQIDSKFGGPNGVLVDREADTLFVVTFAPAKKIKGSLLGFSLKDKKMVFQTQPIGSLDGITFDKDKNFIVSDWGENYQGKIYRISREGKITPLNLELMRGPADIDVCGNVLWIPKLVENKVSRIQNF